MKHKHYEIIMAWAEGKKIQLMTGNGWQDWVGKFSPHWNDDMEYRIKPEPKPDVVVYTKIIADIECAEFLTCDLSLEQSDSDNLKLTFDSETGKLKSAEVI